ncbi:MAG: isoleucine--tRNA ligase [Bacteroidales bacterium]|nr:isoleucine--tRNA ligase [Bacteroidales bacterium]
MNFKEYKSLDLPRINEEILERWKKENTFEQSLINRKGRPGFVFYEGPPSANGVPGIHHVMARTIKDIFCRYKTMQGFEVMRKAGWDTHGLPVELGVEKSLGITKEDIGKTISVEEYNATCRRDVMKYTDLWENLTDKMGYWVDMKNPYITYDSRYIETLWWLLKQLYNKNLLYKGYTIQPYSPAAGTGLSTHELNQPGCYRDVKDTTCTAQFKVIRNEVSERFFSGIKDPLYILAWTTTPWTLPSNTALCVGSGITYVRIKTFQPYTGDPVVLVIAKDLVSSYFSANAADLSFEEYKPGDKLIPWKVLDEMPGSALVGICYEQLIPWVNPGEKAFRVISGDYVTTADGTGIVHIAPTFGADDDRVAKISGIPPLMMIDRDGNLQPMVDRTGKFFRLEDLDPEFLKQSVNASLYKEFAGRFVKNAYDPELTEKDPTLDVDLCVMLKQQGLAFRIEKHTHTYPHCWRTDKPVLYYPLDSWFVKTTAARERMMELNDTIFWKPQSTGTGRFGKWLENLQDWNLSRSRFWGTPLPIWRTEDGSQEKCIGSMEELLSEIRKSVEAKVMDSNPYEDFIPGDYSPENYQKIDLHRPYVDRILLVSDKGEPMYREKDLIDVWFDSGAMPYAQVHYPFENKEALESGKIFPANFIAEGVDQTRGWFFTLHAIASMIFDSVAFRAVISNGLVLDKNGNKMSKRLGNAVDPFSAIDRSGSDAVRWYMITNASPWDNLKFDMDGVDEVTRKFFGTLYNTYSFFALYANVDHFDFSEPEIPLEQRPEIDRWIISLLNTLIKEVTLAYEDYEPTRAGRLISDFVTENLSNWYVRLNRKRFWGGEMNPDKLAAYQTLYACLLTVSKLAAPVAPFYSDQLFRDLNGVTRKDSSSSVHLANFPVYSEQEIDPDLEERMDIAQRISSLVLALRRKVNIRVRQPLTRMMIPLVEEGFKEKIEAVKHLILNEVNVKEIDYIEDTTGILVKKIKPNFKTLGPKYSKLMKGISLAIAGFSQQDIALFEKENAYTLTVDNQRVDLTPEDVEIISEDIPGWLVANEGKLTVALDIVLTEDLKNEGMAREIINRIQNLRKDSQFEVTDRIRICIEDHEMIRTVVRNYRDYIASQVLADEIITAEKIEDGKQIELDDCTLWVRLEKVQG